MTKTNRSTYVCILPYFCEEEVDRYLKTAQWMRDNCRLPLACEFLLAASPKTPTSDRLFAAFSTLGRTRHFRCPSQIFGYPQGPTAMFWDCMDYIANNFSGRGFSLWFESDMAVTKADWLSRLATEWHEGGDPIMMGCFVPETFKFRWLRQKKKVLDPHINGGACYSLDFGRKLPVEAREGVFDMIVYRHALELGTVKTTRQIAFSTLARVRRDVIGQQACVLHGFMQDKDRFIDRCVAPITAQERSGWIWHPLQEQLEITKRRLSVCFYRRGRQAVLESMLLAKHQIERRKSA